MKQTIKKLLKEEVDTKKFNALKKYLLDKTILQTPHAFRIKNVFWSVADKKMLIYLVFIDYDTDTFKPDFKSKDDLKAVCKRYFKVNTIGYY